MFFIADTIMKALIFEVGFYFGMFVVPILMHGAFGLPL
jgi:hypothetical protein